MNIVSLTAENIQRLRAVHIEPQGRSMVVVGGRNAQGKTSVLDAIAMAIGGKDLAPDKPVRSGAEKGVVTVDLGDYVVTRTFTPTGGGTLTVKNREGAKYSSPQALLDTLIGKLSFDPLAFTRMDEKPQQETLRRLVGLDTSALDEARKKVYDERTAVNRDVTSLEARVKAAPEHPDAPADPVSVADLVQQLTAADEAHAAVVTQKGAFDRLCGQWQVARDRIALHTQRIEALKRDIADLDRAIAVDTDLQATLKPQIETTRDAYNAAVAALPDRDALRQQISEADAVNAQVRWNLERQALGRELASKRAEADGLTTRIGELDSTRQQAIASARYPVDGLAFADDCTITYQGQPFAQASMAEQIRVSVAIGLALNPRLKVLLVRNGNDLDRENLALLGDLAEQAGAQVWVERVAESADGVTVMIEDGAVVGQDPAPQSVKVTKPKTQPPATSAAAPGAHSRTLQETGAFGDAYASQPKHDGPQVRIVNTSTTHTGFVELGGRRVILNPGQARLEPAAPLDAKSPYVEVEEVVPA